MDGSLLRHAFDHHTWATLQLIDVCLGLTPDQLEATAPGTYGSIRDTIGHLVDSDASYLTAFRGERGSGIDDEPMGLADWRAQVERNGARWQEILAGDLDPDAIVVRHRPNGSESHAPLGIRLAQALTHGADHRSHIATILTTLGMEPPDVDVWAFGESRGLIRNVPPPEA